MRNENCKRGDWEFSLGKVGLQAWEKSFFLSFSAGVAAAEDGPRGRGGRFPTKAVFVQYKLLRNVRLFDTCARSRSRRDDSHKYTPASISG